MAAQPGSEVHRRVELIGVVPPSLRQKYLTELTQSLRFKIRAFFPPSIRRVVCDAPSHDSTDLTQTLPRSLGIYQRHY
jgi:hypothetical protein